ncbi:MAG: hypothetical protein AAF431_14685 [Pseudomonadota bacterium]
MKALLPISTGRRSTVQIQKPWTLALALLSLALLLFPAADASASSCTRHVYNHSSTPVTVTLIKGGEPLNPVKDYTFTVAARGAAKIPLHNDVHGMIFGRGTGAAVKWENETWVFTGFGRDTDESVQFIEKYGQYVPGKVGKAVKAGLKFNIFWNAYKYARNKPDCYWVHSGRSHSFTYGVVFNDPAHGDIIITDKSVLITHDKGSVPMKGLAHLEGYGDVGFSNSTFAGTGGQARRMEGFQLKIDPPVPGLQLTYMGHLEKVGDTQWVSGGTFLGTRGQYRRIEGIAIQLTGYNASKYDIFYVCHIQNIGDSRTVKNGEFCGTRGSSLRLEGLAAWIVKRPDINAIANANRNRQPTNTPTQQTSRSRPVTPPATGQTAPVSRWQRGNQVDVLRPADNRWTPSVVLGTDPIDGVFIRYEDTYEQMWVPESIVRVRQANFDAQYDQGQSGNGYEGGQYDEQYDEGYDDEYDQGYDDQYDEGYDDQYDEGSYEEDY